MKLFMPIAKQVNNNFNGNERDEFYQKTIIILFKISAFLFVPLMLIGSVFFIIDGLVLFAVFEIVIAVITFVFIFLSKPKSNIKLHIILSVLLLTAIFVLVTTGIKGGGFASLITVSVLIFLMIKYSQAYKYYLIAITITFIILTFLLYLDILDSYEIAAFKTTWPFMMVLSFTYVGGLAKIILFYKKSLETQIDQIKESEQRFRILHNASFGGITVHDKGLIIECNQGLSDITGYSIDELVGMDGLLLIAPDYRDFVMNKITSGYEDPYEAYGIRKNKEIYPLQLEARNIPYNKKQVRVVEFRDISELKQQEEERIESEKKYQLLFATMNQGVVFHDNEGYITSCNPRAEEILGLSLDEMQGKTNMDPRWKMIDEDGKSISGENHPTSIAMRTKEKVGPVVRAVYRPDIEEYIWLRINATPLFVEGEEKPYQVYATFEDITKERKADLELSERNEMIESLFNNMITGAVIYEVINDGENGEDYIIRDFNDVALSWENKKRSEVVGKAITELHPEIEKSGIIQVFRKVWKTGKAEIFPAKQFIRDGYNRWHENSIFKLSTGEIVAMYNDITEKMKLELDIIKEKETLAFTLNSIGDAVIATDAFGIITGINPIACELTGWNEEDAINKPFNEVFNITFEDKNKKIINPVEEALLTNKIVELANHTILISKDKTEYFIEDTASPIKNANGENIGVVLVFRDVTEKKKTEREVKYLSEHDYLTGLYNRRYFQNSFNQLLQNNQLPLGIMMIDVNGLKIINDAYGHNIGDKALKIVADVLKQTFSEEEIITRLGGDEFAVLISNSKHLNKIQNYKDEINEKLSNRPIKNIIISLAIGFANSTDSNNQLDEIFKSAENKMYRHKISEGVNVRSKAIKAILNTLTEKFALEKKHSELVSKYAYQIGKAMNLKDEDLKELKMAGLYHDIGKISIPDEILDKPGKLTKDEFEVIKTHTETGYQILRAADEYSDLAVHALHHHERWDGKGYPKGLKKTDIPLFSRIICIADAYEAMISKRPYKKAISRKDAIKELKRCAGTQFDPEIVKVFINL